MKIQIISKTVGQGANFAAKGFEVKMIALEKWAKLSGYAETMVITGVESVAITGPIIAFHGNGFYASMESSENLIHASV